ncbi:MAG: hypothetical protein B7Z44_09065 [Caulobacter sp. 12-67-6]|nr:MAG: hypothetical protein B7Z44_09065 [Caulobacter sp. 12-67-6]
MDAAMGLFRLCSRVGIRPTVAAVWTFGTWMPVSDAMPGLSKRGVRAPAFAVLLACVAIALRVLIPQGYMVAASPQAGSFPIVLCTSQGARTINSEAAGYGAQRPSDAPVEHPDDQKSDPSCAFSVFNAGVAAEAPLLAVMVDWRWARRPIPVAPQTTPGRGLAAPPPPSTGPPLQI